jgi:hypothetical protein
MFDILLGMKYIKSLLLLFTLFSLTESFAQAPKGSKSAPVIAQSVSNSRYTITYGSTSWNKAVDKIDQAFMFVREKKSGKIAKILLEETAPDSAIFSGPFALDWKTSESGDIEAFVIEEVNRYNDKALSNVTSQIQSGKIQPSPLFLRAKDGVKQVDVYDTKAQADRARSLFENQLKQVQLAAQSNKITPLQTGQAAAVQKDLDRELMFKKMANEAIEREAVRLRLEQLENQRLAQLKKEAEEMSAAQKAKRNAEADELGRKGMAAYNAGEFKEAEELFSRSLNLNPNNRSFHFMYGVSLYRNEKFNDSLVALKISPPNPTNPSEKSYYIGLVHYRLKEYAPAKEAFAAAQKGGDPVLAPSATFYNGLIFMSEEKYEASKEAFEWVLDNSKDPALDKQAEENIELIARYIEAQKLAAQKWKVNGSIGAGYDSNILFAPDGEAAQGLSTDDGGFRTSLSGDVNYRIFYKPASELSAKATAYYMYSIDSKFASADPFQVTAALPYLLKGTVKQKGYSLQLTPGYETLYMDANDTGTRDEIQKTVTGTADLVLVMREDWYAGYTFDVRQEDSLLESAAEDNLDATKITLKTQQTFLLGKDRKRAVIASGGLTLADAKGNNKTFNRIDLGAIYSTPAKKWKDTNLIYGLSIFTLDYNKSSDNRKDNNFSLLAGFSRPLNKIWNLGVNATYTNNASTVDDFQYSQYALMSTLSFNWAQ